MCLTTLGERVSVCACRARNVTCASQQHTKQKMADRAHRNTMPSSIVRKKVGRAHLYACVSSVVSVVSTFTIELAVKAYGITISAVRTFYNAHARKVLCETTVGDVRTDGIASASDVLSIQERNIGALIHTPFGSVVAISTLTYGTRVRTKMGEIIGIHEPVEWTLGNTSSGVLLAIGLHDDWSGQEWTL